MKPDQNQQVPISSQENDHILDYIKSHNAAVLTIMFTDIVGFTEITEQKGDEFSSVLHQKHDLLLRDIIERQFSGLIIKFIGDSVMAIFSEPSVSVETAIAIQRQIKELTVDSKALSIRIGLHVGQVSVENNVQLDIFGCHVNRASRIENLAFGDQVLMSYSVFDSARGWLKSQSDLAWQDHGLYKLKGIPEKVNIFEVYSADSSIPRKPKEGAVYQLNSLFIYIVLFIIVMFFSQYLYKEYISPKLFIDNQESMQLRIIDSKMREEIVKLDEEYLYKNNGLSVGRYLVYYPISKFERKYSILDIDYGMNKPTGNYTSWLLPRIKFNFSHDDSTQYQQDFDVLYWNYGAIENKKIGLSLIIEKNNDIIDFKIAINKSNHIEKFTNQIQLSNKKIEHFDNQVIWKDPLFNLVLKSYQANGVIKGELVGEFR